MQNKRQFVIGVCALGGMFSMAYPIGCRRDDDAPRHVPRALAATVPNATKEFGLDLGNEVVIKMTLIPAGEFLMGTASAKEDLGWEMPQHRVTISRPFYMGVYEITKEQYRQVMGAPPSTIHEGARMPVEEVSWDDAVKFCVTVSQQTGTTVRLPTEAEWEYACRAGSKTRFCQQLPMKVKRA